MQRTLSRAPGLRQGSLAGTGARGSRRVSCRNTGEYASFTKTWVPSGKNREMNSVWSSTTFLYLCLALGQQFLAFCKFVVILPEFFFGRCQLFIGGIEFLVFLPELLFNPLVFGNVNGNTENGLLVVAGRSEGDFGRLEETVFSECINIRFFRK